MVEEKKVLDTIKTHPNKLETITFEGSEKVKTTLVHRFYVVGKGYIEAKDLS